MKDEYKVPICECGEELELEEVFATHYRKKINITGKASKKERELPGSIIHEQRLICTECGNQYEYQKDKKGRYLRGEKY